MIETPTELISRLNRAGVRLWVDEGRLRVRMINEPLPSEDVALLRTLKSQVVTALLQDKGTSTQTSTRSINAAPLTYRQESLWRLMQVDQTGASRLVSQALKLAGQVDIAALDKSFCCIVDRHEALRTTISHRDGIPLQNITTHAASPLEVIHVPRVADEAEPAHQIVQGILRSLVTTAPNPLVGPLFQAKLLVISSQESVLAVMVHHLITDGVSINLLWNEFWQLYGGLIDGHIPDLPKVEVQSGDYAIWQRSDRFPWNQEYWQEKTQKASRILFPVGSSTARSRTGSGAFHPLSLTPTSSHALRELARRENTMLGTVVLALFAALIIHQCRQYEFALPFQISGRPYPQHVNMMGYFAHPLIVWIRASETDSFSQLVQQVAREFLQAQRFTDCGKLLSRAPGLFTGGLFQWFSKGDLSNSHLAADILKSGAPGCFIAEEYPIALTSEDTVELVEQDIMLCLQETSSGMDGYVLYRVDLFTRDAIQLLARDLQALCEFVTSRVHDPLSTFSRLNPKV